MVERDSVMVPQIEPGRTSSTQQSTEPELGAKSEPQRNPECPWSTTQLGMQTAHQVAPLPVSKTGWTFLEQPAGLIGIVARQGLFGGEDPMEIVLLFHPELVFARLDQLRSEPRRGDQAADRQCGGRDRHDARRPSARPPMAVDRAHLTRCSGIVERRARIGKWASQRSRSSARASADR